MEIDEILSQTNDFKYQLLSRMIDDCEYYLGNGNRLVKWLWANDERKQIEYMRAIYESFDSGDKPEWISESDIDSYENRMCNYEKMKAVFVFLDEYTKNIERLEVVDVELASIQHPQLVEIGRSNNPYTSSELQGQPLFEGFLEPMWDGDGLRYETEEVNAKKESDE